MGGCLSTPADKGVASKAGVIREAPRPVAHDDGPPVQPAAQPAPGKGSHAGGDVAAAAQPPPGAPGGAMQVQKRGGDAPWGKLNDSESAAVKHTLLKVSELIERFAEGSAEREAPIHALKKALALVAADCHASYASMSVVSTDQASFLVMGAVGSSHEATTIPNLITQVEGSNSSVEWIMAGTTAQLQSRAKQAAAAAAATAALEAGGGPDSSSAALQWAQEDGVPPPSDWLPLQCAGIRHIHAMPIRSGGDGLLAVLNLGFKHEPCLDMGFMGPHLFSTYLSLVSATLTAVVRDPGLNAYVCLARDLAAATSLDGIMQAALVGSRAALTRLKGMAAAGSHTWLRLALISGDKSAAALFDDLSLAGVARGANKRAQAGGHNGSTSAQWVATIQAAGGLVRTNIPMKNTILRIALTNKKQVLIPDVQKLINQLGNVNTDLFASRLLRPPSSVLLLPLRASGVGNNEIFGALYCLADVNTEFSEVAKQLKEVAELLGLGLNRQLGGALVPEYLGIQQMNHEQLLARDGGDGSCGSFGMGGPLGSGGMPSHTHSSGGISPSTVTPATTAGSLPHASYSTTGSSSAGGMAPRSEGSFMAAATAGGALEFGSTIGTHASWAGSMGGSMASTGGGSFSAQGGLVGRSFVAKQVASSTNAVATGITEKLNQKRIDAAMAEPEEEQLGALQLVAQIGEGGFAKVFRGLYRGLVVAVKVVSVGDPSNERAVMKNAHEIAILRSSSHPNIIQAYSCLTDVRIRDVIVLCTRHVPRAQKAELVNALTACAGTSTLPQQGRAPLPQQQQQPADDATCHIEVVEYCDLGNLTTAIRNRIFALGADGSCTAAAALVQRSSGRSGSRSRHASYGGSHAAADDEDGSIGTDGGSSIATDGSDCGNGGALLGGGVERAASNSSQGNTGFGAGAAGSRLRVNMRWLLLTLLEVAEGMAYLHRMGVVHCDMKPANVLLKSSNADLRGFTAKVSDFGLSRVEDDDSCATFPFNSCGTAAYVAPEALITTKKVNASVDVYAFGIMMWELFVGQRPYGNMTQQKVVEEVVLRGLRPSFPVGTPLGYAQLAASCWHATAASRPCFQEVIGRLQAMLHQAEDSAAAAAVSVSLTGSEAWGGRADGLGTPTLPPQQPQQAQQQQQQPPAAAYMQHQQQQLASAAAGPGGVGADAAWHQQQGQQPAVPAQLLQWQQQQQQQQQGGASSSGGGGSFGDRPPLSPAAGATAAAAVKAAVAGEPYTRSKSVGAATHQQQAVAAAALAAAGSVYEYQAVGFGGESVHGTGLVGSGRLGGGSAASRRRPSLNSLNYGSTSSMGPPSPYDHHRQQQQPGMTLQQQQQQQLLLAAAAAAASRHGGSFDAASLLAMQQQYQQGGAGQHPPPAHRPPARSKTFTAGTSHAHHQQQQMAQMMAQLSASAGGGGGGSMSGTGTGGTGTPSSASFADYASASSAGGARVSNVAGDLAMWQQQQQQLLQHHQQLLQQQRQSLLLQQAQQAHQAHQQHLEASAGQQQQALAGGMRPASFTFAAPHAQTVGPRADSSAAASAAAAIAAAQQKAAASRGGSNSNSSPHGGAH